MDLKTILDVSQIAGGIIAAMQIAEYLFTKNVPWLVKVVLKPWQWMKRRIWGNPPPAHERYMVLNFSGRPILPKQEQDIQTYMDWPSVKKIELTVGNLPEDKKFVVESVKWVDQVGLSSEEWQTAPIVVVLPGYAVGASVVLAELHGRMGYFPNVVRICPNNEAGATERFKVAEVITTQKIRDEARAKR